MQVWRAESGGQLHAQSASVAVIAEISLKSPRELFIFVNKKSKSEKKKCNFEKNFTDNRACNFLRWACNLCGTATWWSDASLHRFCAKNNSSICWILRSRKDVKMATLIARPAVLLFSKLNKICFGHFDPVNIFLDFRGGPADISAKKEALRTCRV